MHTTRIRITCASTAAGLVLLTFLVASCVSEDSQGDESSFSTSASMQRPSPTEAQPEPNVDHVESLELLPFESVEDIAAFGDHFAVFDVVGETEIGPDLGTSRTEGFVGRTATIEIVESLWSYPGAPELPRELVIDVQGGFVQPDGEVIHFVDNGARIEVGERYIASFVFLGEWRFQTSGSVFLVHDGVISGKPNDEGVRADLAGTQITAVDELLAESQIAAGIADTSAYVNAYQRYQAIGGSNEGLHVVEPDTEDG